MKLCTFKPLSSGRNSFPRVGLISNDGILLEASGILGRNVESMQDLLNSGPSLWHKLVNLPLSSKRTGTYEMKQVKLMAPLPRPQKILLAIANTQAMLGGKGVTLDHPRFDMKAPSAVVGPGDTILAPSSGIRPEVELAAIIGRKMKGVAVDEAKGCIFGYTVFDDVTAPQDTRDDSYEAYRTDPETKQLTKARVRGPLFRSKNHDTFAPMGPVIVTGDAIETGSLRMVTKFNGELIQSGSTSEYLFKPEEMASFLSQFLTLEPGDVISCGSVGWEPGVLQNKDPSQWVLPSSRGRLELEVEGIGALSNPVEPE